MDSTMEIFEMIKDHCREKMPTGPYTLWIKDIVCEKLDDKSAVLMVTTNLRKQIIESKYYDFLKDAFEEVLGFHVDIKVESLENKRAAEAAAAAN